MDAFDRADSQSLDDLGCGDLMLYVVTLLVNFCQRVVVGEQRCRSLNLTTTSLHNKSLHLVLRAGNHTVSTWVGEVFHLVNKK